jgi:hypothetical protein
MSRRKPYAGPVWDRRAGALGVAQTLALARGLCEAGHSADLILGL